MQKFDDVEDLRVRRTSKLLTQALIEGTVEKGFAALTVRDITRDRYPALARPAFPTAHHVSMSYLLKGLPILQKTIDVYMKILPPPK